MTHKNLVYVASLLALATAGVLAWAVSHPCACEGEPVEEQVTSDAA